MSRPSLSRIVVTTLFVIAAVFCLLGGCAMIRWGVDVVRYGEASRSWPSVIGTIEASSLENDDGEEGSVIRAFIEYSYTVGGVTYRNTRIGFGDFGAGPGTHAEDLAARYPKGARATVYYLERDPRVATLRQGRLKNPWPMTLFGAGWVVFGLILVRIGWGYPRDSALA